MDDNNGGSGWSYWLVTIIILTVVSFGFYNWINTANAESKQPPPVKGSVEYFKALCNEIATVEKDIRSYSRGTDGVTNIYEKVRSLRADHSKLVSTYNREVRAAEGIDFISTGLPVQINDGSESTSCKMYGVSR